MVEGEIAADTMVDELDNASVLKSGQGTVINSQMLQNGNWENCTDDGNKDDFDMKIAEYNKILNCHDNVYTTEQLEDAMQKVMDTYAGGIGSHYQFNEKQLELAKEKIEHTDTCRKYKCR
jgi:adenylylsulfate reductase subunit A